MARIYRVPYTGTIAAADGDSDLLLLLPADDKPCALVGFVIGQSTELGDAQEENLRITIRRLTATVTNGSGGSAVTPVARDSIQAAAGFTARCNDTTVATTSGTNTILEERAWNERNTPYEVWWPEEDLQPAVIQGEALVVRNETTVADSLTVEITFFIREMP